jgi:hypothetical protein
MAAALQAAEDDNARLKAECARLEAVSSPPLCFSVVLHADNLGRATCYSRALKV